jgi:hypothetical protein
MPSSRRQQTWCGHCAMGSLTATDQLSRQPAGPGLANVSSDIGTITRDSLLAMGKFGVASLRRVFPRILCFNRIEQVRDPMRLGMLRGLIRLIRLLTIVAHPWLTKSIWRGRLYAPVCLARLCASSPQRPCFSALVSAIGRSAMPAHERSLPQDFAHWLIQKNQVDHAVGRIGWRLINLASESAAYEDRIFPTQGMSPTRIWAQI